MMQVVPTIYRYLDGRVVESNQYAVTEHVRHINPGSNRGLPGAWCSRRQGPSSRPDRPTGREGGREGERWQEASPA